MHLICEYSNFNKCILPTKKYNRKEFLNIKSDWLLKIKIRFIEEYLIKIKFLITS